MVRELHANFNLGSIAETRRKELVVEHHEKSSRANERELAKVAELQARVFDVAATIRRRFVVNDSRELARAMIEVSDAGVSDDEVWEAMCMLKFPARVRHAAARIWRPRRDPRRPSALSIRLWSALPQK